MHEEIRVLVVDDSTFIRRAVERMLESPPGVQVVGTASNGEEAVALVRELHPDVVILDVNMPHLDGLEALRRIMEESPTRVLMLSTHTREGTETTLRALELGAVDFLDKSAAGAQMDIYQLAPLLRQKVLEVAGASVSAAVGPNEERSRLQAEELPARVVSDYEVVVIGASTGGPRALNRLLSSLPAGFPVGIVVAQHMPEGFTLTLAERLNRKCGIEVREASDGDAIIPGLALLAPGGRQLTLEHRGDRLLARVTNDHSAALHHPSVDLLFHSAATVAGRAAIGVVLTGMGDDGASGLQAIRDAGGRTLAESHETAVIYGMPRAAAAAAELCLPIGEIGGALVDIATKDGREEGSR